MITPNNFVNVLQMLGFTSNNDIYEKIYPQLEVSLKADIKQKRLFYPEQIKGRERNDSYDDSHKENLVVFECVHRLMEKGYRPEHIELEKEWHLGHDAKSGRADICVTGLDGKMLFIIECKTIGREYQKEQQNTKNDGGQLFSYWQQERSCQWLLLYASDYVEGHVVYHTESIDCHDDNNILLAAQKDATVKLYQNAYTAKELFSVWDETYEKRFCGDVVFRDDTIAYQIGIKPLRKADLKDFAEQDSVVNQFEEILRHNNVSDKENAFNRLVALFICKLVDEIQKGEQDVVEFQYKVGTDTYESLQDRLQRLHRDGMKNFMREEIFYVSDNYADELIQSYTGQNRQKMIADLKRTLRILKFYTNNDFAFKDVHNEELFYQNGKILVEVVQLFEKYRIIGSSDLQVLGDLFEQLLNKGFKQNEGQFFTPIPITRFIWDSLPLDDIIRRENELEYPKIVDYACGAGHFLTQGYEAVEECCKRHSGVESASWVKQKLYGIEKDYRLARVSKISLFMHGAGTGNIIFGDGLENYGDKNIIPNTFDILVANPPYSVSAFKPHLKLKNNDFSILPKISNTGSEIETLFAERIAQLVKPGRLAAVILPSSILNKENESFIAARESLLTNFRVRAIAQFGSKTFGATGTNTIILFLQKYDEPPKRIDLVADSVQAILRNQDLSDWEDEDILAEYLKKIGVASAAYQKFLQRQTSYTDWNEVPYFAMYVSAFQSSTEYLNKTRQRSFIQSTEAEKLHWCNQYFYDFAITRESEKLTYFALCYRQTTLVITAPSDNSGQETFLGYTWSNRKGQEGIQVKREGGLLYCPADRRAENTLAALVRSSFTENHMDIAELATYYHWMKLQDMLDFGRVEFNKALKINKSSYVPIHYSGQYPLAKIEEYSPYVTEKINVLDIPMETYITTDNLLKDKQGVTVYQGTPQSSTVTKYQKNDILVSNIRPYLKKIWFANCNGGCSNDVLVFRSYDSEKLLPEYLFEILRQDAFFDFMMATAKGMKMPRGDKNVIKGYEFPNPPVEIQQQIVDGFHAIDEQIKEQDAIIKKCDENVKSRFVEMFGDPVTNPMGWETFKLKELTSKIGSGATPKGGNASYKAEGISLIRSMNVYNGYFDYNGLAHIDDNQAVLLDNVTVENNDVLLNITGASVARCCVVPINILPARVNQHVCILRCKNNLLPIFLNALLISEQYQAKLWNMAEAGATRQALSKDKIEGLPIITPPVTLQNQFADFVALADKSKYNAQNQKESLLLQREQMIEQYFR